MVKPVRNMILVKKNEVAEKLSSGLYIPQTLDERMSTGKVVAVGSGHLTSNGATVPLEVKVDDVVAFDKSMTVEITIEGQKLLLMREDQLFCIL
jgi:chaperonin GroES